MPEALFYDQPHTVPPFFTIKHMKFTVKHMPPRKTHVLPRNSRFNLFFPSANRVR